MNPAQIILEQLGGNKFIAMTGCKNFLHDDHGYTLIMDLPPNKSNARKLRIHLNGNDCYDMLFFYLSGKALTITRVAEYPDVFDDMLKGIFTHVTGLDTHL